MSETSQAVPFFKSHPTTTRVEESTASAIDGVSRNACMFWSCVFDLYVLGAESS